MEAMTDAALNGFLLGLATGPLCMMGCLPALISMTLGESDRNSPAATWRFIGKYIAGRLFAYLLFGFCVGYIGARLAGAVGHAGVIAWMVMSLFLVVYGLGFTSRHIAFCSAAGRFIRTPAAPYLLGALAGINICPPFLLAVTYTLDRSSSASYGVVFFLLFFLSTTLYILPAGLSGYTGRQELFAKLGKGTSVVVGIFFLARGISTLIRG